MKLLCKLIAWLKGLFGCKEEPPVSLISLNAGVTAVVYRGQTADAKVVFAKLINDGSLLFVRYQTIGGYIKELYYTTFPTEGWVNEIGKIVPGETYYIKVGRDVKNFPF